MPRDPVSEILQIKQRAGRYKRIPSSHDIDALARSLAALTSTDQSPSLVPVRIVTLIEVFLRHWIEIFIDFGAPYVERGSKLAPGIKYDFAVARSLHGGAITLGQLIAHSVQLSRLDSIVAIFSTLLGKDLFDAVKDARDKWKERSEPDVGPIITDVGQTRRVLARLFEVRHIIVHEFPEDLPHRPEEVADFLDAASKFIQALEEEFTFLLYGNVPLSQYEMNRDAADQYQRAKDELEAVCLNIEEFYPDIREVQRLWQAFKEAEAERMTRNSEGGSIRPMVYSLAAAQITRERITQIQALENNRMD
ncbi:lysozyme inhibitor LprI family protein [Bradyrhizobium brasilense]|uniref:lysozyme inhibitor LprI family protein n=1 Tax=Bradyrhizobium brasilense TaxID=1419277 RepID=UPI0028773532|nr:lysozyme inhibitor LprI family protein [Bradyrhizobium brasilense]MCP3414222.1 lysozyme inhibitor LprI family protein [Bradyrhizobium brasilense]